MHNYKIKNVEVENLSAGGYKAWDGTIPIITDIQSNGDGTITWWRGTVNVRTGVITAAPS